MDAPAPFAIEADLARFVEGPVAIVVASADGEGRPHAARGYAARVHAGGRRLSVHVPEVCSRGLCEDLRAGSGIAVVLSRVEDFKTYQIKGASAEVRPAEPGQVPRVEAYQDGFCTELESMRISREASAGFRYRRFVEITFAPTAVFDQTPGPQAGCALPGAS
ncbi:MAG: hypothetical protein OEZ06_16890 [Myxococcales bacterium]|nr:hypothetical protein [Myxococcales bacterium]